MLSKVSIIMDKFLLSICINNSGDMHKKSLQKM